MLELKNISKRYRGIQALRGINIEVRRNEIFVLLGPTGAGKTTTLLCVAGLESVTDGHVMLHGRNITDLHPMGRDMTMVFEGYNLFPILTVRDNIAFPLRSPVYRQDEAEIRRRVQRVAEDLHIARLLDRDVETLSGGERQRVAIARAIVRQPSLYLLDEPLSALDLKLREELRVELRQLHERHGSTMLYATHDYHGAAAIANRIAILEEGQIRQTGTLDELFSDPRHARVGALLGSPSMAFFPAQCDGLSLVLDDLPWPVELASLGHTLPDNPPRRVVLGLWPEDIELSLGQESEWQPGTIYATDFRGIDRAVQVQFGNHFFRKVVDIDFPARQGDACCFRFQGRHVFLFDEATGERIGRFRS